jgi:HSP20 family protein
MLVKGIDKCFNTCYNERWREAMEDRSIKELRLELGLSQERFAQLLGVSLQTVRRWEEGLTKPLPIMNLKLAQLRRKRASGRQIMGGGVRMTQRRRRPERESDPGGTGAEFDLGGLFKGIGNFIDLLSKMTEEGKEEYARTGELKGLGGEVKGVYGFSVKMGLGGKPIVEQFGNIKATQKGAVVEEVREPIVDVFDEGEQLMIIAELPGVEESGIHLEVNGDILDLTAEGKDRKYSKEVLLPLPVAADAMESSYKNGILEVRFKKRK